MYEKLGDETLRSGERLEIGVATAPEAGLAAAIADLLVHKHEEWRYHIAAALRGETDDLETRFYLGLLDGKPVANIMTTEQRGTGILGHVFTRPEHRRKGICSAVMTRQMEHFRYRGGEVLILGTGFESPPYWIYHSFGFRSLKGGFMRYGTRSGTADAGFEQSWFATRSAQVVEPKWKHWPLAALLASVPGPDVLRSRAWHLYGIGNLEGPYVGFIHRTITRGDVQGAMLEAGNGAVVGCATAYPAEGWPGVTVVDVFAHANYSDRLPELIGGLRIPPGRAIAYIDSDSPHKASALEANGFAPEAVLRGHLRMPDGPRDVHVYSREAD